MMRLMTLWFTAVHPTRAVVAETGLRRRDGIVARADEVVLDVVRRGEGEERDGVHGLGLRVLLRRAGRVELRVAADELPRRRPR
jgi:hypothetical protein